jgi:transposase-like protein
MVLVPVKCPHCGSTHVRKNGTAKTGKQRYLCLNENCPHRTFPDVY